MSNTNYVSFVDEDTIGKSSRSGNYYKFLQDLYWYYERGGFLNILVFYFTTTASAVFTLCFIFLLSTMVRWNLAFEKNPDTSMTLLKYPTKTAGIWWAVLGTLTLVVSVASCIPQIITAWRMKRYCNNVMLLDDDEVSSMPWDVFVRVIADRDPRILGYNGATWQHLVMVITRKTNYMVGLYNQRLINVSVPWFPSWRNVTTVFEWTFELATADLWTELGEVNPDYISGDYTASVAKLRRSFVRAGILGLLLSPLVFIAMLIYAFFTFLDEVRNSPGILFSRTWSTLAKWRMRCVDEVDCCLNDRLACAYPPAREYTRQFKSAVLITFARFLVYALAILIAPLVVFSLIAEDVLEINIWGEPWPRKVIYVFTIVAALLAIAREMVPGDDFVPEPQRYMTKVLKHVRLPPLPTQRQYGYEINYEWVRDAHSPFVRQRFSSYFKSKGLMFLSELTAVITVPFIFMYSLYDEAGAIVKFLRDTTVPMGPGLGTKFIHSGLDSIDLLPKVGDQTTTAAGSADQGAIAAVPITTGGVMGAFGANAAISAARPKSVLYKSKSKPVDKDLLFKNKIAESIITFKGYYPHWSPTSSGSSEVLANSEVQQYGSTAYRPDPTQIVEEHMLSYLGRRAANIQSNRRSTTFRRSTASDQGTYQPPTSLTASSHASMTSTMDMDHDDDGNHDANTVELEPLLHDPHGAAPPRRTSSAALPSSAPTLRGDDMV